jgi:hypothetical protein
MKARAAGQELTAVWSDSAQPRDDDVAARHAGRRGPSALETTLAEVRCRLDEAHAQLCFAERQLAHDRGIGRPVLEIAASPQPDGSRDPEAAVRSMRKEWAATVRRLDDVRNAVSPAELPVLEVLGRERGLVRLGRRTMHLRRRHTEILVLLAHHPLGMTTGELALALYGDTGRPASARTELCRLRKDLAPWIYNERNRVKLRIEADFLIIQRVLRSGRAREAAQRYSGQLLPRSEAPGIVELRDELDGWVRSAVMTSGDREALWAWLESDAGCEDVPAWKRFLADLDYGDPRRPLAVSRLGRLRSALTLVR